MGAPGETPGISPSALPLVVGHETRLHSAWSRATNSRAGASFVGASASPCWNPVCVCRSLDPLSRIGGCHCHHTPGVRMERARSASADGEVEEGPGGPQDGPVSTVLVGHSPQGTGLINSWGEQGAAALCGLSLGSAVSAHQTQRWAEPLPYLLAFHRKLCGHCVHLVALFLPEGSMRLGGRVGSFPSTPAAKGGALCGAP